MPGACAPHSACRRRDGGEGEARTLPRRRARSQSGVRGRFHRRVCHAGSNYHEARATVTTVRDEPYGVRRIAYGHHCLLLTGCVPGGAYWRAALPEDQWGSEPIVECPRKWTHGRRREWWATPGLPLATPNALFVPVERDSGGCNGARADTPASSSHRIVVSSINADSRADLVHRRSIFRTPADCRDRQIQPGRHDRLRE